MPPKKPTSFPVYDLDVESVKNTFSNVGNAIDDRDYRRAVEFATTTFDQIQRQQLVTVVDHRAYALGMQGKFDQAIKDAKHIIAMAPDMSTGYLRLGYLYQLQGKQLPAVDCYNSGLQNVLHSDKDYQLFSQFKEDAAMQASKKVDFIARLPNELVYATLSLLSKEDKVACLTVSRIWRTRLMECWIAWTKLSVLDDDADKSIANILPHIACYVEQLTLNTTSRIIWGQYSQFIQNNYFSNIMSLTLEEKSISLFKRTSLRTTFGQIRKTLTALTIEVIDQTISTTISDILETFDNLQMLKFMPYNAFADALGNITARPKSYPLVDLHLGVSELDGPAFELLLRQCQQLQRLVLEIYENGILDVIKRNCPSLKILGFNSSGTVPSLNSMPGEICTSGLRVIDATDETCSIPTRRQLELLTENSNTLESIKIDLGLGVGSADGTRLSGVRLDNLKSLEYISGLTDNTVERAVLRSLSNNTKLTQLRAHDASAVDTLADTLVQLPPVEELWIEEFGRSQCADTKLKRLFQHYATIQQTTVCLKIIKLGVCESITDEVLESLAQVESLTDISLHFLRKVTVDGLHAFLEKLGSQVSVIDLGPWDIVTDYHLDALASVQGLKTLELVSLIGIYDYGIINMVNKTKSLRTLKLQDCITISDKAVNNARRKVDVIIRHDLD